VRTLPAGAMGCYFPLDGCWIFPPSFDECRDAFWALGRFVGDVDRVCF